MKIPDSGMKRVLVVEDEPVISNVCERVLTSEGCEVDLAVNGKVAQDMIEEKQYDLCLIDIRTPEMNGKELYRWLQQKHPQLASRVIFTTGDVMSGDRPFLPKPFTLEELRTIVTEALKGVE